MLLKSHVLSLCLFMLMLFSSVLGQTTQNKGIQTLESLEDFYTNVNNQERKYTFIKYFTPWCHHCKQLKPIFERILHNYKPLSALNSFSNDTIPSFFNGHSLIDTSANTTTTTNGIPDIEILMMEVDCELFGGYSICSRLPGFPALELIKPLDPILLRIEQENAQMAIQLEKEYLQSLNIFSAQWYKFKKFMFGSPTGSSQMDSLEFTLRKHEFLKRRKYEGIVQWMDETILNDMQDSLELQVYYNDCSASDNKALCAVASQWFEPMREDRAQLELEFKKLNNILNTTSSSLPVESESRDKLNTVKFKLNVVERKLLDFEVDQDLDEL